MNELYRVYRPSSFQAVIGQDKVVEIVKSKLDKGTFPHASLWSGPSGCGKTTLARIVASKLKCNDYDFEEMDFASVRGIDAVRSIQSRIVLAPMCGPCRVVLIDEAHKATSDAQSALLKIMEDTPDHVYFMLATTDPQKLLKTIRTRCMEFVLKPLDHQCLTSVIQRVLQKSKMSIGPKVVDAVIELSDESARKALVLLDSIIDLPDDDSRMKHLESTKDARDVGILICRKLIDPKTKWDEIKKLLQEASDEPETIRRMILGYASSVLLGGGNLSERAYFIIVAFEGHFFDSGKAGLVRACFEVFSKK